MCIGIGLLLLVSRPLAAQVDFLRIGSGSVGGTYYPVAQALAETFTHAPDCGFDDCGIPGLLAVAQASSGSVNNVRDLAAGRLEAAIAQSDVIYRAFQGVGSFEGETPLRSLRVVANLYPETVHFVVRADSGIRSVAELDGRRVSLEEPGSGSLPDALLVLGAYGLDASDLRAVYLKPGPATERMLAGELDALVVVAGVPMPAVVDLAEKLPVRLLPISGPAARELARAEPFFNPITVPAETYPGVPASETLAVGAQLVVDASLDPEVVYALTRALWSERGQAIRADAHPRAREIDVSRALDGVPVPLHPGAERFYRDFGLLP